MIRLRSQPLLFSRGRHFFQIALAPDGEGEFIGLCDGRIVARACGAAEVASILLALGTSSQPAVQLDRCRGRTTRRKTKSVRPGR